jgi:nuclear pore complex protein Nup155
VADFITQLALDNSRDLLYALTNTNNIILYNVVGKSTAPLQRVGAVGNLAKLAQTLCPPLGQSKLDIISIDVMPAAESSSVHLVAVTATGVRLYFTTLRRSYGGYGATTTFGGAPSGLELVHVRIGPSSLFDPRASAASLSDSLFRSSSAPLMPGKSATWHPTDLNITGYYGGMFFASQTAADDKEQDILLCTAPDLPRIANLKQAPSPVPTATTTPVPYYGHPSTHASRPTFSECTSLLALTGKAWAIAHLPTASLPTSPRGQPPLWNELVTQSSSYADQFLVLTNDGLSVVAKRRAIDCLKDLIEAVRRGGDESMITAFFDQLS